MDGIAIWLLFLVFFPFVLFFWRMLQMVWKSFMFTKKIKNLSDDVEIPTTPITIIVNPSDSYVVANSVTAYGCFVGILLLLLVLLIIKMALKRKQILARNALLRRNIAHRNQLSTVSHSVDVNSNHSNDEDNNTRRDSEATIKIDLPPTYEEVMKNYVDTRHAGSLSSATRTEEGSAVNSTTNTHEIVSLEILAIPTPEQRSVVQN